MENEVTGRFDETANQPARPAFLTTLCILTWVWCGITFLTSVFGQLTDTPERRLEQIEQMRKISPEAGDKMEEALESQTGAMRMLSLSLSVVSLGLSAFGAWLMFNLKRKGFFVYIAGELLPYAGFLIAGKSAAAVLSAMGGMGNAVMGLIIALMLLADIAFFIMYGVNLKHMNKS